MTVERQTGDFVPDTTAGVAARAFIPRPLPPQPPLVLSVDDHDLIAKANQALGRLSGLTKLLPDTHLLIYMYIRKEAVLSSQIEGTVSSLEDLLVLESANAPGVPIDDTQEVLNYVRAIERGRELVEAGLPIAGRLLKETHRVLLEKGRGASKQPGEYRRTLVRLGGTNFSDATFIPPPAINVPDCMHALEQFLNDEPERTPTLLKAALAHVQFETIHPFRDGNGRLGRLLITLLLCAEDALREPTLYLSLYFKTHRQTYYDKLQRVRTHGDWEGWLRFFLRGILTTTKKAEDLAEAMLTMFTQHRKMIVDSGGNSGSALRVHEFMQRKPIFSIPQAKDGTKLSQPTVGTVVDKLIALHLVRQLPKFDRPRLFAYGPYVDLLNEQNTESPEDGPSMPTESADVRTPLTEAATHFSGKLP